MILYPPDYPIAFSIFNIQIRWYGIIMALAIFAGVFLGYYLIKKNNDKKTADDFFLLSI